MQWLNEASEEDEWEYSNRCKCVFNSLLIRITIRIIFVDDIVNHGPCVQSAGELFASSSEPLWGIFSHLSERGIIYNAVPLFFFLKII